MVISDPGIVGLPVSSYLAENPSDGSRVWGLRPKGSLDSYAWILKVPVSLGVCAEASIYERLPASFSGLKPPVHVVGDPSGGLACR